MWRWNQLYDLFQQPTIAPESKKSACDNDGMELLIEEYKGKLENVSKIIATTKNNGSVNDITKFARLSATQNEYRLSFRHWNG